MTTAQTLQPIQFNKPDKKSKDEEDEEDMYSEYNILKTVVGEVRAPLIYTIYSIMNSSFYAIWISIFILIWIISGFVAFLASFVCLFYNSSIGDKMAGLVLALFAGPFYWLFYIYNSNYCKSYATYN
jgi:hypothetical protein